MDDFNFLGKGKAKKKKSNENVDPKLVEYNDLPDFVISNEGKTVSIVGKNLTTIPKDLAQKVGDNVEELNFSFNDISKIENLNGFKNLKKLVLDNNCITNPGESFPKLPKLETLWINKNNILDLEPLLTHLEKNNPNLSYLSLMQNPCCPNPLMGNPNTVIDYSRFRLYVLYRLKNLKILDSDQVTSIERRDADKRGKYYKVKKIDVQQSEVITRSVDNANEEEFDNLEKRKFRSYFGYTKQIYTGKHSEGNRFIKNKNL